jgi:hypothetical protein
MKTLYELLGVGPDASEEALKRAYRKLAKLYHPDLHPNDPDAARRFRQIATAISILCDAKRRAAYDHRLLRELQRRLDRERERYRLQLSRIFSASGIAAIVLGIVAVEGPDLLAPVSRTSVFASQTTTGVARQPVSALAARQDSTNSEDTDKTRPPPTIVLPFRLSIGDRGEVRPQPHCNETVGGAYPQGRSPAGPAIAGSDAEPHCGPMKGSEADERGLSENERAVLIRQAQVLLASGDTKNAHSLLQRACRNSRSQCSASLRESL